MPDSNKTLVYLHSTLVDYSPDGKTCKFNFQLAESSTIDDLLTHLGVTHSSEGLLYGLNGEVANETSRLNSG
ncbi:MAG: hypothetical protein PVI99_04265 [Anaerolineales bacterium]|jgi:hypothetical protein